MTTIQQAASEFLSQKRIAVTGVSRTPGSHGGNVVFKRLRDRGYEVFAVNPNADEVEGARAYPNLEAIPGGVDAVVIATRPDAAVGTMRECVGLGIKHTWMHRSFGVGSFSEPATEFGLANGVNVIAGGCPLMFEPTADPGHKVMKVFCRMAGNMPKTIPDVKKPERSLV